MKIPEEIKSLQIYEGYDSKDLNADNKKKTG